MNPRLRLILSLLAVASVFVVSTIGYHVITDASYSASAYMTVITLSTVGYNEVIPLDGTGRLWNALMIVFGIATVSVAFTSLLTLLVSGEFRRIRGRSRMQAEINRLENHVIICGGGRMGSLTTADLRLRKVPSVIIEQDPVTIRELMEAGTLFVEGDATLEHVLLAAGLKRARALVAVLPHDADNVYVSLTARGLRPDVLIIARAEQPSAEIKLRRAGADRVVLPHVVGAGKIANILTRPSVVDFFETASQGVELELDQFTVREGSPVAHQTLRDSGLRQNPGVIVVAIKKADGAMTFNPPPDQLIEPRDTLIMVGPAGASAKLERLGL